MPIKLCEASQNAIGNGQHRSGWPFVLSELKRIHSKKGILFDDFIERSFCHNTKREHPYTESWGGIIHAPSWIPELNGFHRPTEQWSRIFSTDLWAESLESMKYVIFTCNQQKLAWDEIYPNIPSFVVYHPTELDVPWWSFDSYEANESKSLVQLGFYIRNTRAIYQVPDIERHQKVRILNRSLKFIYGYDRAVVKYWKSSSSRGMHCNVRNINRISDIEYDNVLSKNIILTELFASAANNVVIECIARNTPLIVNRQPAVEEYLGKEYPLFFDDISEVPTLIHRSRSAYEHLRKLDKSRFTLETFREQIIKAVQCL